MPLVSNTLWAYMRPRLLVSNSSLYTTDGKNRKLKPKGRIKFNFRFNSLLCKTFIQEVLRFSEKSNSL